MPELPEVETVRSGLAPVMEGQTIRRANINRPNLRFAFPHGFCARLTGAEIMQVRRRAKYLLIDLSRGETLIAHLGMSGRFSIVPPGEDPPPDTKAAHDHVEWHLSNDHRILYNDPRRFGFMDLCKSTALAESKFLAGLGPEPLGNGFSSAWLTEQFSGKSRPVKSALLDQHVVAGLGNIYVCEALFRAGIHPKTLVRSIGTKRRDRLLVCIREVIAEAIKAGGSTLRDYAAVDGALGYFQHRFSVYGREGEPCAHAACPGTVRRIVQSGRSSFYCPRCQR
ncbi:MAG: bifunctional DNA-formamidopyrimidine glycosylase/DNA-(apurinic or apyrimidinic site) lyase [Robiginitomaculum sp.]|nr:bifunctional DNA-formamidopyrimidine glycosylase/DNA-(apurinic or apyrimidinic site) lyase [Robiginitomaculum sp.]MDQ7077979.1 bifunctional DNA-formamidopyrimidine glycosylase/DNA-(apurinic or apyrimidinic site) lyase [Robiginitomaculum sp.]